MSLSFFSKSKFLNLVYKNIYCTSLKCSTKPVETKTDAVPTSAVPPSGNYMDLLKRTHRPNNLERKILVWTGRFKSKEDIPDTVSHETMERARNRARIKIANYMMAATVVGCIIMVISGKRAAERGQTLTKMNLDWHKEISKDTK